MQFQYTAKSESGTTTTGVLAADNPRQAQERLRADGLFVMSVQPSGARTDKMATTRPTLKVSQRDLLAFTTQFAIMTRAGIDPAGALASMADQCRKPHLQATLRQIHQDVTSGSPVSKALQQHPRIFNDMYVSTVAAGESSGRLSDVLQRLVELQRAEIRNRNVLRTLLAYPSVLATVSLCVLCVMVAYVLPQFAQIFADTEVELPPLTYLVMAVCGAARTNVWWWGPLLVLAVVVLVFYLRTDNGRRLWHQAQLNLVIVRHITRALLIGRAFRLMGMMIGSGVPMLDGLRLARGSVQNILYRDLFQTLENDILNGRGLGSSLLHVSFIPPTAAEMVITAERTGTMGVVMQMVGEHYEEEGQERLRELATILEPSIIVGMGVVVGVLVVAVMLPMFDMATLANAR